MNSHFYFNGGKWGQSPFFTVLSDDCYLVKEKSDWLSYLIERDDETQINNIRQNTKTGRPCGNEVFVKKIEDMLVRKLAHYREVDLLKGRNKWSLSLLMNKKNNYNFFLHLSLIRWHRWNRLSASPISITSSASPS